jgi:hypothetical protein
MLAALAGLAGCGGGGKPADSPENSTGHSEKDPDELTPSSSNSSSSDDSSGSSGKATSGGGGSAGDTPSGGTSGVKTPYDKDAVDVELKRAARQVKGNCGAATDENGSATGPWGKFTANITLGRNGHIKQVTVPSDYDGKPVGICVVHAFQKITFPPYAGSSDAAIDYEIEVTKPKK